MIKIGPLTDGKLFGKNSNFTYQLPGSRILGYAEYGDPEGKPLMFFHGFPGSRLDAYPLNEEAAKLNVRLIAIDRPGFGLSEFVPGRTILDWPEDVVNLADSLGIKRFGVLGFSGGAPYAAACGYKIPDRVTVISIVSGLAPLIAPGFIRGMNLSNRTILLLAPRFSWFLKLPLELKAGMARKYSRKYLDQLVKSLSAKDRDLFSERENLELLLNSHREGFRLGSRGLIKEIELYTRPWGFRLEDISLRVILWHGEEDTYVPINMGRYLSEALRECTPRFYREGHFSLLYNYAKEILKAGVRNT